MIEQIIYGVEFIISNNIEYINIKPENILINKKNIKLVDYGMKFLEKQKCFFMNNYMSPELFKNLMHKK